DQIARCKIRADVDIDALTIMRHGNLIHALEKLIEAGVDERDQGLGLRRGFDRTRATSEQRHAQAFFQLPYLLADGLRADQKFGDGSTKTALAHDGPEDAQGVE